MLYTFHCRGCIAHGQSNLDGLIALAVEHVKLTGHIINLDVNGGTKATTTSLIIKPR